MTAEQEREAIVAWLREASKETSDRWAHGKPLVAVHYRSALIMAAATIESRAHLQEPKP